MVPVGGMGASAQVASGKLRLTAQDQVRWHSGNPLLSAYNNKLHRKRPYPGAYTGPTDRRFIDTDTLLPRLGTLRRELRCVRGISVFFQSLDWTFRDPIAVRRNIAAISGADGAVALGPFGSV